MATTLSLGDIAFLCRLHGIRSTPGLERQTPHAIESRSPDERKGNPVGGWVHRACPRVELRSIRATAWTEGASMQAMSTRRHFAALAALALFAAIVAAAWQARAQERKHVRI